MIPFNCHHVLVTTNLLWEAMLIRWLLHGQRSLQEKESIRQHTELVCRALLGAAHGSTLGRHMLIRLQLHGQRSLKEKESIRQQRNLCVTVR